VLVGEAFILGHGGVAERHPLATSALTARAVLSTSTSAGGGSSTGAPMSLRPS
jgi:hypothetical protein